MVSPDHGEPPVDGQARCQFADRREIGRGGKPRNQRHRERAQVDDLHHRASGRDRTDQYLDATAGGILSHLRRGAVGHLYEIEIRAAVEKLSCERGCAGRVVETDRQFAVMGPGVVENSGTAFTGSSAFTDNICGPRLHTMACGRGRTKELDWIPGLLSCPRLENAETGSSVEADTGD
jgi:hypothetical protein